MSSGSESDEEYVPGEPEQVSEEESADEETELQYENEQEHKPKKRKANSKGKNRKKIKTRNDEKVILDDEDKHHEDKTLEDHIDPEEEKKKEDDLWAKFLEGTDTKPKPVKEIKDNTPVHTNTANKNSVNKNSAKANDEKERERRIFDFAGEKIVVENNVVVEKVKSDESSPSASQSPVPSIRKGGGISNILDQLNKKNKLSTLEKSKLDWNTFKKDEGIEDEIVSHNKGKAGYLDRRDFLERTEYRQYEIERDLRMSRRSNR